MRQRISEKNKFPSFDLFDEYQKLEAIFSNWRTMGTYDEWRTRKPPMYTFEDYIRDLQFENWNLRGTFINLQEMRSKLNIAPEDFVEKKVSEEQLLDFIQFLLNCWLRIHATIETAQAHAIAYIADKNALEMLFQNCKYLLEKFHCKCQVDEENNEVYVIFKDDLATIISQKDPDVEPSLTEYNRIDNCGNIRRKGEILCTLSKKLEAVESQIKGTEFYPLYNDTTFLLNKIGARHWTGKDKLANATFMKMSPDELEKWYDTTFNLVVSCLAAVPYLTVKDKIKEIKQTGVDK